MAQELTNPSAPNSKHATVSHSYTVYHSSKRIVLPVDLPIDKSERTLLEYMIKVLR